MPKDLRRAVLIRLHIDSSAALSVISRTGLGKAKHIEIQHLWLQEAVRNNKLTVEKIPSETLPTWARSTSRARDQKCDEARVLLLLLNATQVGLKLNL